MYLINGIPADERDAVEPAHFSALELKLLQLKR